MLFLKPIFRTILLSMILALLIIYLGIKYHWSDYLKPNKSNNISSLKIPPISNNSKNNINFNNHNSIQAELFKPEIIPISQNNDLISSMNKNQVEIHCKSLLRKSITNSQQLNLAVVNCIVSNYQESLQTINDTSYIQKKEKLRKACQQQFVNSYNYSNIEKQLLIGICTSDRLTQ